MFGYSSTHPSRLVVPRSHLRRALPESQPPFGQLRGSRKDRAGGSKGTIVFGTTKIAVGVHQVPQVEAR